MVVIGTITSSLNQRRGNIVDTDTRDDDFTVTAEVPLNEMFGCKFNFLTPLS